MENMSRAQYAVYQYIRGFIEEHAYPPTVREIGAGVGLKSTSTVHLHIRNLASKGYIRVNPSKQRSITLAYAGDGESSAGVKRISVVGDVAAGKPILAYDNIQDELSLPASLLHGAGADEAFLLNVEGESMIDAGILNGDLIIVHNGIAATNGDIVVARVGGDSATVKRLFVEHGGRIRLQPENQAMEPIILDAPEVEIIGKVIGLIRRY